MCPNFSIARGLDYYTGQSTKRLFWEKKPGEHVLWRSLRRFSNEFRGAEVAWCWISIGLTRLFYRLVEAQLVAVSRKTPRTC